MTLDDVLEILEDRGATYAFLSTVYGVEASAELLTQMREQVVDEPQPEDEGTGYELLRQFLQAIGDDKLASWVTELAADYAALFLAVGRKPVPPYESVYTSADRLLMQRARDEVLAEYRKEGLGPKEGFREPEDHIAMEMEFMGYLCQKALESLDSEDAEAARASLQKQKDFLDKHLLVWVPEFCKDVRKTARTDFYKAIAQITEEHLSYEGDAIAELMNSI
jgi:anaerobic sulfite reductase subunit A